MSSEEEGIEAFERAAQETRLQDSHRRRFIYSDVETLIINGFLHQSVEIGDHSLVLRTISGTDQMRLIARTGSSNYSEFSPDQPPVGLDHEVGADAFGLVLAFRRLHHGTEQAARFQVDVARDDLPRARAEPFHQRRRIGPAFPQGFGRYGDITLYLEIEFGINGHGWLRKVGIAGLSRCQSGAAIAALCSAV